MIKTMRKGIMTILCAFTCICWHGMARQYPKHFNRASIQSVSGEISEIFSEQVYRHQDFVFITLKTKDNGSIRVEIAPQWFMTVQLKKRDKITVTGSKIEVEDIPIIIVQTLQLGEKTFQFRDQYGFPLWRGFGKGQVRRRHRRGQQKGDH